MPAEGYLSAVLADGATPFHHGGRVRELLGLPPADALDFTPATPRPAFGYLRGGYPPAGQGRRGPDDWDGTTAGPRVPDLGDWPHAADESPGPRVAFPEWQSRPHSPAGDRALPQRQSVRPAPADSLPAGREPAAPATAESPAGAGPPATGIRPATPAPADLPVPAPTRGHPEPRTQAVPATPRQRPAAAPPASTEPIMPAGRTAEPAGADTGDTGAGAGFADAPGGAGVAAPQVGVRVPTGVGGAGLADPPGGGAGADDPPAAEGPSDTGSAGAAGGGGGPGASRAAGPPASRPAGHGARSGSAGVPARADVEVAAGAEIIDIPPAGGLPAGFGRGAASVAGAGGHDGGPAVVSAGGPGPGPAPVDVWSGERRPGRRVVAPPHEPPASPPVPQVVEAPQVVVVHEGPRTVAFWERRHLSRIRVGILR